MRVNRMTSDGSSPAGRLDAVEDKLRLSLLASARGRGETGRRRRLKIAFPWSAGSSPAVRTILLAAALSACDRVPDSGPVLVSAIGGRPVLVDPGRGPAGTPSRLLTDSIAQGLVRFDAGGQIEAGLAERWTVIDGTSYIFRLRDARWSDGTPVSAQQVAARLQRQIAPASRNPLKPFLSAIDQIVVMTPQVIEIQLSRPRPDLLKLFAQPELAIIRLGRAAGTGPLRPEKDSAGLLLRPVPDILPAESDDPTPISIQGVRLTGERAALAVARFAGGGTDLVTGGTFTDWPLLQVAGVAPTAVRTDPAAGLFGLSIVSRAGFLADAGNRAAVAQAIDRAAVTLAVAPAWSADARLLPSQLDSAAAPALPDWTTLPFDQRQAAARARVAAFGAPVRLRIGLPTGPGATRLWGQLARSLLAVGITPDRVALDAPAELRLLDAVAPYDSARWYLATACQPCGDEALAKVEAAREAPTLADRAARIAEADAALTADTAFIAIARPWRWSLVSPRLRAWTPNARAWHPLTRLRPGAT